MIPRRNFMQSVEFFFKPQDTILKESFDEFLNECPEKYMYEFLLKFLKEHM